MYPYAEVSVVTNGLLLNGMNRELIEVFKETNTQICISVYPPILDKIDKIVKAVRDKGIVVRCSEPIYEFSYTFDFSGGHSIGGREIHCTCPNLYEGHLAVCPPIAYMKYYNDYFAQDMDGQDGLIDIYDNNLTYDMLIKELHKMRHACDNCLFISEEDAISMKWEQSKERDIRDYVWMEDR